MGLPSQYKKAVMEVDLVGLVIVMMRGEVMGEILEERDCEG